jgi:hypothetical protein
MEEIRKWRIEFVLAALKELMLATLPSFRLCIANVSAIFRLKCCNVFLVEVNQVQSKK